MTLADLICKYSSEGVLVIVGILTLIQITPIRINPWSAIGKWIGQFFTHDLIKNIQELNETVQAYSARLSNLEHKLDEHNAIESRIRIIRFGDEISHNILHSKNHYDQILIDITSYEKYCNENKNFKNDITGTTINIIKDKYREHSLNKSFLD